MNNTLPACSRYLNSISLAVRPFPSPIECVSLRLAQHLLARWKRQLEEDSEAFPGKGYQSPEKEEITRPHGSLEQITPAEFKAEWQLTANPKKLAKWLS